MTVSVNKGKKFLLLTKLKREKKMKQKNLVDKNTFMTMFWQYTLTLLGLFETLGCLCHHVPTQM